MYEGVEQESGPADDFLLILVAGEGIMMFNNMHLNNMCRLEWHQGFREQISTTFNQRAIKYIFYPECPGYCIKRD
jgi:hypothetical protein